MESMTWTCIPQKVEFTIEDIVLGRGGFRTAYKAKSSYPGYNHTGWVVKKYLDECRKGNERRALNDYGRTYEKNSSNALAKNFAFQLTKKVKKDGLTTQYGETIEFKDVFFEKIDGECITLEEFIEGDFIKYISKEGKSCLPDDNIIGQKAQCSGHFSYENLTVN